MKYLILTLVLILMICNFAQAQTKADTIEISSYGYYIGDSLYTRAEISDVLKLNNASEGLIHSSDLCYAVGGISMSIGVILTGFMIYDLISDITYNSHTTQNNNFFQVAIGGIGFDILGIILLSKGNTNFKKSIKAYNSNIKESTSIVPEFKMNFSFNRIGFSYKF